MKRLSSHSFAAMAVAGLAGALLLPMVLGSYDMHVLMLGMLTGILALSLNYTLGYAGQPNFGQAALFGCGAYASALLTTRLGVPFWVSLLTAIAVAGVAGLVIGFVSLQLRGAYFCMVTIAIGQVFMLLTSNQVALTGGPMGTIGVTAPDFFGIFSGRPTLWIVSVLLIAIMLWVTRVLEKSVMGRAWVAIRESETLSQALGINSFRYALTAYVVGALFAGAGGSVYAHYIGFVDPTIFAFSWSSIAVVSLVIGGRGTVWGPLVGGILVTLIPEYLRVAALWRLPVFGLVLILIVELIPDGIIGLPRLLKSVRRPKAPALVEGRAVP